MSALCDRVGSEGPRVVLRDAKEACHIHIGSGAVTFHNYQAQYVRPTAAASVVADHYVLVLKKV